MRRSIIAALVPVLLASCVAPQAAVPTLAAAPVTIAPPRQVATPAPAPLAVGSVEPGSWSYGPISNGTRARFESGNAVSLTFDCTGGRLNVRAIRLNPSVPDTALTLRATSTVRTVAVAGGNAFGAAQLDVRDPLLDALAFSRGKFAIAIDGRERWYPAWPEVARVVEDCRA